MSTSAASRSEPAVDGALDVLPRHWPEYAIEAAGLGTFMVSACIVTAALEHPASPVRQAIGDPLVRRVPMGIAMGLTAIGLIYSPWGRRSGAHLNPAVTLTFWRLGKLANWDAVFYVLAQFGGGLAGVGLAALLVGRALAHPAVAYATTVPGAPGAGVAFAAEAGIAFLLMTVVLFVSNRARIARFTGLAAGALVAAYIVLEAPLSGMSMNPARTVGSGAFAGVWTALWVYFTAPLAGMLAAAQVHGAIEGAGRVRCAKLHHDSTQRCVFRCGYREET